MIDPVDQALNRYLNECEASDGADEAHNEALRDYAAELRADPILLRAAVKAYVEDEAHAHESLLVDISMGSHSQKQIDALITAAVEHAQQYADDAPKYRSPVELKAEHLEYLAEQRHANRSDI